jgi:hypothetical protein
VKTLIATILFGGFCVCSTASADVIYHCEPVEKSKEIAWVQISTDESGAESFAISWKRPVGREDIQETEAGVVDDFTVTGFYSEEIDASLLFYTEDDIGGERTVLELEGSEFPVLCKSNN